MAKYQSSLTGPEMDEALGKLADFGISLLWTNPSPTENFSAQTVSLSLSGISMIAIVYLHHTSTSYAKTVVHIVPEQNSFDFLHHSAWSYMCGRTINITAQAAVFGGGMTSTNGTSWTVNDGLMIPYKIYGIHF